MEFQKKNSSGKNLDVDVAGMQKKGVFSLVLTIFFTLFSLKVYAVPLGLNNFSRAFESAGRFLAAVLNNTYAVFGITVVIFTMMFYNIFTPLMSKIPVFKGDNNEITNKYGRLVSLCFAMLSSLGIFGLIFIGGGAANVQDLLTRTLGPFATLAGILVAFVVFGIIYFGLKDADVGSKWKRALWGAGLALLFIGFLLNRNSLFGLGWLIVFILLFMFLFGGSTGDSGNGKNGKKGKDGKDGDTNNNTDGNQGEAEIKVCVRTLDDQNIQGAEVIVKADGCYHSDPTNADGMAPSDGYYGVPAGKTVYIKAFYDLSKDEKYRSKNKFKLRKLFHRENYSKLKFRADKKKVFPKGFKDVITMNLNFKSEYAHGFEPKILKVKLSDNLDGSTKTIDTTGKIDSLTGGRFP
jgi:hypothetical protein